SVVNLFYPSGRRHTSWNRDWKSDVYPSNLRLDRQVTAERVDIVVRVHDLSLELCTAEDAIRFTHALDTLATTGRIPPPLSPAEVDTALHATGNYAQDGPVEARMRSAWDRALMGTRALWNCEEVHSGPALGWLHPGEHTYLVLVGTAGVATDYLAVTDRRVFRGSAPGRRTDDRAPVQVREAVYDSGFLSDTV